MRINPINYEFKNNKYKQTQENTAPLSFTSHRVTSKDLDNVVSMIKKYDSSRLDGTFQKFYQYSDYMVKAPDLSASGTPIKEFYALSRLEQSKIGSGIAPKNAVLSRMGNRYFLVEEFVNGKRLSTLPSNMEHTDDILKSLFSMDVSGVVNHDLSPINILIGKDNLPRVTNFDTYSFIANDGKIIQSASTPSIYYLTKTPVAKFAQPGRLDIDSMPAEKGFKEIFADSFYLKRKRPHSIHDLMYVRDLSENPYIGLPSNLASFESRTLYKQIMNGDVENPADFLCDYIQKKANTYHTKMRDYLKTLDIKEDSAGSALKLSGEQAKTKLQNAIKYEDFLINLFGSKKPDPYFGKLEAAKIQLNALLYHNDLDKEVPNSLRLPAAYRKLMKVIREGLGVYDEPEYKTYLESELKRYKNIYARTGIGQTNIQQIIPKDLDIIESKFKGIMAKGTGKHLNDFLNRLEPNLKDKEEIVTEMVFSGDGIEGKINHLGKTSQHKVYRIKSRTTLKKGFEKTIEKVKTQAKGVIEKVEEKDILDEFQDVVAKRDESDLVKKYARKYTKEEYLKMGGKLFAGLGIILATAGYILYQVMSYRKEMQSKDRFVNDLPYDNK